MDRFFQIQGAWANRDMSGIRNLLTDEMYKALQEEADQLRAKQRICGSCDFKWGFQPVP